MDQTNDTADEAYEFRIGSQPRRSVLRALAASGSVAALGGIAGAQEGDDADETAADGTDEIPVAGEFPAGETVGLQRVASNLPGPTDFDYVEVNEQVYHFIVTQTGQVFVTTLDEQSDDATDGGTETADAEGGGASEDAEDDGAGEDVETDGSESTEDDAESAEGDDESAVDDGEPAEADDDSVEDGDPAEGDVAQEFVFNGVIPGWFGMEPDEIDGTENPTLELTAGETYRFTWENGDGQPHNVVILDAGDNVLEQTEIIREAGETQTLEFEATEEMERYVCEVHPGTMTGRIQVTDGEDDADDPETEADADALTPADMELFLDIEDRIVDLGIGELGGYDERGLLGIAFHPEFAENQRFYVRYSAPEREGLGYNHTDVLAEFQADENLTSADPESERTIMEVSQPQDNHNGGRLAFGPDGYLYTSIGDGGNVHDIGIGHVEDWYDENEGGNAQDTTENPLGGVHRIDVDAEDEQEFGEYGIPDDNPLVDSAEDVGSYWAWGFRNPWGMSIDDDGQLFVSDAGQHRIESVYAVEEGGNYSWNVKEGTLCFSTESPLEPPEDCPGEVPDDAAVSESRRGEPLRDPIAEYQHTRISEAFIDSSVVTGGHRYAGEALPEFEDAFVFGNWSSQGVAEADGEVLAALDPGAADDGGDDAGGDTDLVEVDERWELEELQFEGTDNGSLDRYVYGVERDENGELYVLANTDYRPDPETGEVYKIVPADEGEDVPAPEDPTTIDTGGASEEEMPADGEDEAVPEDGEEDEAVPEDGEDELEGEEPEAVDPEDTEADEAFPQDDDDGENAESDA